MAQIAAFASPNNEDNESKSTAKYIQGTLSMVRSKKLLIPSLRNGVMVINIEAGGSINFYKVWRGGNAWNKAGRRSSDGGGSVINSTMRRVSSTSSLLELYDNSQATETVASGEKQSIFLNKAKSRRNVMQVDEETKAKIEKVSIYVSSSTFREPMEMPYLHIPASVPWVFKSINKYKNEYFQITVPPLPNGELDTRVKIMSFADKVKKFMQITTVVDGKLVTFGTVMDRSERSIDDSGRVKDIDMSDRGGQEEFDEASTGMSMAESTMSVKMTSKNEQIFVFKCPNARDLAIYAKTALTLNRMYTENRIKRTTTLFTSTTRRVRTAEGLEIALQNAILDRSIDKKEMVSAQSTLGTKEYRCLPLYAYPYSWLTENELKDEMIRPSKVWCDLRENGGNEMGFLNMEVLQCSNIPKLDAYSLSDPMVYVVCGSSAFVTDVIPDKLDAIWLPLSRRACILPVANAYSQVYVGCFDYDGEKEMDDFIGRVVLDISQLQAGFTYDVTLPLRDSSKVYNRNQLGFIRLRFKLEWNDDGARAALLSYLPTPDHIKKRMKNEVAAVTVKCPDSKSFYNVAHTVYGKDIPGCYSNSIRTAATRELDMFNKMVIFSIKGTIKDISNWKHPLLSGYIFFWWMHFVIANSMALVPAFAMSLVVILLLRNYVKYYVKSSNALLYGHKAMGDMIRTLLFKNYKPKRRMLGCSEWKLEDRPYLERLLLKIFGMSTKTIDPHYQWKYENHAEFPFSVGDSYPKLTHLDANENMIWNDDEDIDEDFDNIDISQNEASTMDKVLSGTNTNAKKLMSKRENFMDDTTSQIKISTRATGQTVFSNNDIVKKNAKSSTHSSISSISSSIFRTKKILTTATVKSKQSFDLPSPPSPIESSTTESPGNVSNEKQCSDIALQCRGPSAKRPTASTLKSSLRSSAEHVMLTSKILKVSFNAERNLHQQGSSRSFLGASDKFPINLPEQNVKAKQGAKKSKPIQDEISELHEKVQKATFYMFDDRVFIVDSDRKEGERALKLHDSVNPVLKMINPLLGGVFKIVDSNLNAFRAIFNILMWKDPNLSFWATIFAIFIMCIFVLFPWRWAFAAAGLYSVGPQNYFLVEYHKARHAAKKSRKEEQAAAMPAASSFNVESSHLSASPLLFRNNTQMKPDGKSREIIIPSVPLRYNRFYDWPPDPTTTIIRKD